MEREKILERARQANRGVDYVEAEVVRRAHAVARAAGILLAAAVSIAELAVRDRADPAPFLIWFGGEAAAALYSFIRLRKKADLLLAVLWSVFAVVMAVVFVLRLRGAAG